MSAVESGVLSQGADSPAAEENDRNSAREAAGAPFPEQKVSLPD